MEPRYTDDKSLPKLVADLAALKREGSYWDFKREWHGNKADLLHDIICMANNPEGTTGLLIIGIDEGTDYQPTGAAELLGRRMNAQNIVDMLRAKSWADGIPKARVASIELHDSCVDVIVVGHDDESVPYYLTADFRDGGSVVRAAAIYTRNADSNTPKDKTANPLETERLWRRHFGLDKTPLERLPQLLADPSKWIRTLPVLARDEECHGYCYCHTDFPEFTFVRKPEEDWDRVEYFMLASPFFSHPNWWTGYYYYHQTMICRMQGAYSDHLWIPEPKISVLRDPRHVVSSENAHFYAYYLNGSLERVAMMFELDESKEGPSASEEVRYLDSLIPVFEDGNERKCFEGWIESNWSMFLDRCNQKSFLRRVPKRLSGSTNRYESVERHVRESATLVDLLEEYREHM